MTPTARLFCFILAIWAMQVQAQTARIEADSAVVETGNPYVLRVTVSGTRTPDTLDLSPWQEFVSAKNILSQTDWVRKGNSYVRDFTLLFFDADTLMLAPLAISWEHSDTVYTDPFELIVYSTPSSDDLVDMAPIKDIMREQVLWMDYLPLAGMILGGLAVLWLLYYWYSREKNKKARNRSIGMPPHELALKKLEVLQKKSLWQQGEVKAHCAELTFILREYLEKRYRVLALESTSQELLKQLQTTDFPLDMKADLENLLVQTDLVKFAKAIPEEGFYPYSMDFAKAMVVSTIPPPPSEEPSENPQTAE